MTNNIATQEMSTKIKSKRQKDVYLLTKTNKSL